MNQSYLFMFVLFATLLSIVFSFSPVESQAMIDAANAQLDVLK